MTKEEILDLQAVLDLEQTGLLDEKTISRLDDYINQSKFASSDKAKKVIERNKKFGLSTEQTIDDIRELVIKSILEKIYKDDENKATRIIIEYVNNSLPKEADIVKTFMDYGQEELAKSYMSGGLLSFLRYDEGGKLQYKVGSAELVNKIMNNPEFYNAVLNSAFNGNEKRMRRFLEKSAKAGNFVKHTFNVEPNSFGQVQRSVKSDYVDWNPAEGVSDSFLNSGRKPNIFQRIFTGGENKVEKGLDAVATLVANNPEIAKLLESENSKPIEAKSTSTQIETSTTENKQTEQNKQVEENNINTNTETSNTNSGSEGSNTKVVKQDEGKNKVIKRRVPIDNSAAIKAGEERSKLYNSWSAYPELQREYKLLWFEKGGAKADQAKIHEEILQELRKRGLIDANNQYIKKKSDNNNPPPEDEGRDIDYKRRSGDDPLPPENKAGEKNLKPYKVGEKITVNGKTYGYKGKMWEDGEWIHNFIDEKGKPYFLTHDEYLERSTDFTPYNSDEGFTAKDLLTTTAGTVVGGLLGAFLGGRRTGKVGNPLAKKKLFSGLKTKGKTPTKKTTPSNSSSTSTTTTSSPSFKKGGMMNILLKKKVMI